MRMTGVAVVAVSGMLVACGGAMTQAGTPRQSRNVITQAQLTATNTENLYDAISKLQPEWLTSRGPTSVTNSTPTLVSVFMNGTQLGRVDILREMRVVDVTEIRYWEPGPAAARFGMGHPRGVIEISRR